MRYSYSIAHVLRKTLWTANTLSLAPLRKGATCAEKGFMESMNIYVDSIMQHLPVNPTYLEKLKEQLKTVCALASCRCTEGWLDRSRYEPAIKLNWRIPHMPFWHDVLAKLHEGHQGMVKHRERARLSVWCPGLNQQLNEMVLRCRTSIQERQNHKEPLLWSELPDRTWQKLGADLFVLESKTYLLVVDYHSRIQKFPQSNGEAECMVQTVKNLKKAADPYLALLAYRVTPLQNGYSPAELLMGRQLYTTVPTLPALLDPSLPDGVAGTGENRRATAGSLLESEDPSKRDQILNDRKGVRRHQVGPGQPEVLPAGERV
ncbi:hypothetical protein SKAU_G00093720 [Synaphobranchus kaupii]|uniref:Gypsy retrotransposon integrase-like protein 1 n=1 Tax=Synaphobranchus kaupii TaxID=118154 RepID=A0A9Q1FXR5_SYNKA|nr:hypothetical protein SKAU_G00093720 [Synaphobranchus kaupii]